LGRITKQALTFYGDQPDAREYDLVEIAEAALRLHADKLGRHGATVARQFRGPVFARVFGNEILQVLSNLILNAVDAISVGQGRLVIRVSVSGPMAHITVCDNGSGIPSEVASRMFEPYVTSKESGTGIGLCLSHRIIENHRGHLSFKISRQGGQSGTSFRISLPRCEAA
jgi:signal transduction histidine kinase